MNPTSTNKTQFKEYMKSTGMAVNTANNYQSALNSKVTDAIRTLCNDDLGSIFAIFDARLLTHWLKTLKEKKEFEVINQDWNGSPYAALKKYIEYVKQLPKQ